MSDANEHEECFAIQGNMRKRIAFLEQENNRLRDVNKSLTNELWERVRAQRPISGFDLPAVLVEEHLEHSEEHSEPGLFEELEEELRELRRENDRLKKENEVWKRADAQRNKPACVEKHLEQSTTPLLRNGLTPLRWAMTEIAERDKMGQE